MFGLCEGLLDGYQIAVLLATNVEEMGYDNRIVHGIRSMEQELNVSGTLIVNDITSESQAMNIMQGLIEKEYKLIITTSPIHGNASVNMAEAYPNINFATATLVDSNLTNLYQLT